LFVVGIDKEARLRIADTLLAQTCCAPISQLSCLDLQREMKNDKAGELEFRVGSGGGYSELLKKLSKGLNFELNFIVSDIRYNGGDGEKFLIEIRSAVDHGQTRVRKARRCIVTVPIGILKSKQITFQPNLPKDIEIAIDQFEIHAGTKIFVCFRSKFWTDKQMTYVCNHLGLLKRWWCSHDQPMLCSYVTSFAASDVVNKFSEEQLKETIFRELNQLFPKTFTMELMNENFLFVHKSDWASDKFSGGGAYAFCPVGTSEARNKLCQLIQIYDNRLTFAGEHTAFESNPQTTHGAFDSGSNAVDRLLSCFPIKSKL